MTTVTLDSLSAIDAYWMAARHLLEAKEAGIGEDGIADFLMRRKAEDVHKAGEPGHGLYRPGNGVLGTDIDLHGLGIPARTLLALGALIVDLQRAAHQRGYVKAITALRAEAERLRTSPPELSDRGVSLSRAATLLESLAAEAATT